MLQRMLMSLLLVIMSSATHAAVPNIQLHDLEGKPRNVNEFIGQGKWAIVVVWAHDCRVCAEEIHEMGALHKARSNKDTTVLGISIDGVSQLDRARGFAAAHKLPFVNLVAEPEQELMKRFGGGPFLGTPTFYFYDPTGQIVARNIGPTTQKDVEAFIEAYNTRPDAAQQPAKK